MKRTRLKPISDKRKQLLKETHALRYASIDYGCPCDCGCGKPACDPHEMPAGAGRKEVAMKDANAQLRLARECHEEWQGQPQADQIALKTKAIIRAVNSAFGWDRVSVGDVIKALRGET